MVFPGNSWSRVRNIMNIEDGQTQCFQNIIGKSCHFSLEVMGEDIRTSSACALDWSVS